MGMLWVGFWLYEMNDSDEEETDGTDAMNLAEAVSVDPAGYETATCRNCDKPVARRVYWDVAWNSQSLWRHQASNGLYCPTNPNKRAEP